MRKVLFILSLSTLAWGVSSCSSDTSSEEQQMPDGPNVVTPTQEDGLTEVLRQQYDAGINSFAFKLLHAMNDGSKGKSFVCSPLSIGSMLAMINDGATGQTREEVLQALGFGQAGTQSLNEYFAKSMSALSTNSDSAVFNLANALFAEKGYEFNPSFASNMAKYYSATLASLDFSTSDAADQINSWCSQQTNGMIPKMFEHTVPGSIAILLNANYFRGKWREPFEEKKTMQTDFTNEQEQKMMVEMMTLPSQKSDYCMNELYQAIRMDYGGGRFYMTVVLPRTGHTTLDIINSLSTDSWAQMCSMFYRPAPFVLINLPRFVIESKEEKVLKEALEGMGLTRLFTAPNTELSGIIQQNGFAISNIRQNARIDVNENGAEAAAITATELAGSPGNEEQDLPYPVFNADHPFLFFICDRNTGVITFMGAFHGKQQ